MLPWHSELVLQEESGSWKCRCFYSFWERNFRSSKDSERQRTSFKSKRKQCEGPPVDEDVVIWEQDAGVLHGWLKYFFLYLYEKLWRLNNTQNKTGTTKYPKYAWKQNVNTINYAQYIWNVIITVWDFLKVIWTGFIWQIFACFHTLHRHRKVNIKKLLLK